MQIAQVSGVLSALLGFACGAFLAIVLFIAATVASRFGRDNYVIDVVLRFGTLGLLAYPAFDYFGRYFGTFVRQELVIYALGFAAGLFALPYGAAMLFKAK